MLISRSSDDYQLLDHTTTFVTRDNDPQNYHKGIRKIITYTSMNMVAHYTEIEHYDDNDCYHGEVIKTYTYYNDGITKGRICRYFHGRQHCDDGPAVEFIGQPDRKNLYYINNKVVGIDYMHRREAIRELLPQPIWEEVLENYSD